MLLSLHKVAINNLNKLRKRDLKMTNTLTTIDQTTHGINTENGLTHATCQTQNGTEVWNRKTGAVIVMPKTRYSFASSKGAADFLADFSKAIS